MQATQGLADPRESNLDIVIGICMRTGHSFLSLPFASLIVDFFMTHIDLCIKRLNSNQPIISFFYIARDCIRVSLIISFLNVT